MQNANIPPHIKEREFFLQKDKECSETTYKAVLPVDHPGSRHDDHEAEEEEELPLIVLFTPECGGMRSEVALLIRNSRRIHPPSDTGRMCLLHFSIWRGGEGETHLTTTAEENSMHHSLGIPPLFLLWDFILSFPISINSKNSAEKLPLFLLLHSGHCKIEGGKGNSKNSTTYRFPIPQHRYGRS